MFQNKHRRKHVGLKQVQVEKVEAGESKLIPDTWTIPYVQLQDRLREEYEEQARIRAKDKYEG